MEAAALGSEFERPAERGEGRLLLLKEEQAFIYVTVIRQPLQSRLRRRVRSRDEEPVTFGRPLPLPANSKVGLPGKLGPRAARCSPRA